MTLQHLDTKSKPHGRTIQIAKSAITTTYGFKAEMKSEMVDKKNNTLGKSHLDKVRRFWLF